MTSFATFDTYPDTPEWSGSFNADMTVPVSERFDATLRGDLDAQTSNYYSSTGKSLNPNTLIPGYALANFRVGIEEREGGLSVRRWSSSGRIGWMPKRRIIPIYGG